MGQEVGSLYYDLDIDDKKLDKSLDNADGKVKGFGDRISKEWDKAVGASQVFITGMAAAGAAVVGFSALSVKAYMEAEEVMAQTNAVIKSTGGVAGVTAEQVSELASSFQRTTKFADETVQSGENILLTFTNIGKDIFPQATQTMLDMSQALGQDVKASAIQLGKALQDPIMGVTALRKVGVNFTEKQQDVIRSLVESGKAAEAQKMILKELQTEFGGSAEAAGNTFAGKLEILKNSFGDFQEVVGETIVKAMAPFLDKLLDWYDAIGGAEGLMGKLQGAFEKIRPHMDIILGALAGMAAPAIIAGIAALAAAVWGVVAPLIPWAALGAGIVFIVEKIVDHMGGWQAVGKKLQPVLDKIKEWWEALKTFGVEAWNLFKQAAQDAWEAVKVFISGDFSQGMFGFGPEHPVVKFFQWLRQAAIDAWNAIMSVVNWISTNAIPIFNALKAVWDFLYPSIAALVSSLWDRLLPALKDIWDAVVRLWNALNPALMYALGIIAAFIGAVLIGAIWLFINILNIVISVISFVINIIANLINWFANLISWIGNVIGAFVNMVKEIIGWFSRLPENVKNIVGNIVDWFKGLPDRIKGVIGGVVDAVQSPFKTAFNAIARFWNNTVGKISFTAPDWVPGMGGKGFSMPKIPELAVGGITTGPVLAQIGEAGHEAVLPLSYMNRYSTLFDRIESTVKDITSGDMTVASGNTTVVLNMDGIMARSATEMRDIFKEGLALVNQELRAKGKPELNI